MGIAYHRTADGRDVAKDAFEVIRGRSVWMALQANAEKDFNVGFRF